MNTLQIGSIVQYSFPGIMTMHDSGATKGRIVKFSKSGKAILVEDIEAEPQHNGKLYQYWIDIQQVTR